MDQVASQPRISRSAADLQLRSSLVNVAWHRLVVQTDFSTFQASKQLQHPFSNKNPLRNNLDRLYRAKRSTYQMKRTSADPLARTMSARKIRHVLERITGVQYAESLGPSDERAGTRLQGGAAATFPIEGFRTPRTLCTLSWIDGTVGRGYVTARIDAISEDQRQQANEDLLVPSNNPPSI